MNFWAKLFILCVSSLVTIDGQKRFGCYKCIRFFCPHDVEVCKQLQKQVTEEAKTYFHFSSSQLSTCPDPNPESPTYSAWSIMEEERESECRGRNPVCTGSQFEIRPANMLNRTTGKRLHGDDVKISYGAIFGCPTIEQTKLFHQSNPNNDQGSRCVFTPPKTLPPLTPSLSTFNMRPNQNQGQVQGYQKIVRELIFEHCTTNDCYTSFCYNKFLSIPQKITSQVSDKSVLDSLWVAIGILSFTVGIIFVFILGDCCRTGEQRTIGESENYYMMQNYQNTFQFDKNKKKILIS